MERTKALVADDTDIFQLMVYHADDTGSSLDMYLITSRKTINRAKLQNSWDPDLSNSILFSYAISVCDITSRPYMELEKLLH